ncbi:MAG: hypothetical protein LQ337_004702 [Flavoplaca oasis]|nr:MAG: hypothetical protein LQ337_004702 [Flavoplaca oasis]
MATINPRRTKPTDTINSRAFVDTDSCECRLQPIPNEATISSEDTEAWQCLEHHSKNSNEVRFGKWYLQKSDKARNSGRAQRSSNYILPDTRTWYYIALDLNQRLRLRPFDATQLDLQKERCTGDFVNQEGIMDKSPESLLSQRAVKRQSNGRPSNGGTLDETDASNLSDSDDPFNASGDQAPSGDFSTSGNEEISTNTDSTSDGTLDRTESSNYSDDGDFSNDFSASSDEGTSSNTDSFSTERPSSDEERPTDEDSPSGEEVASQADLPDDQKVPSEDVDSPEYKYLHSCKGGDQVVAVQMQNASSWNDVGCLPGFWCKCNDHTIEVSTDHVKVPTTPPNFCPLTALHLFLVKVLG